ncbi:glycine cleavage system protein T [Chromatium okenii]|uniref:glycine cleavage system aminomethyltransferase GcvT n=1 Tax=Chromatium okenii TaxID=61644 RepID=UPI001903CFA1|nr:glycine cleavage system aminomethyltransferase GcvT [Chromatium okenii]MBK1642431.1 glycine cleavage system protein T [Chromatium okenii]
MGLHTPLFLEHQRLGARMVPFGGWEMPLHYGSQLEEHHAVRREAGMFDVSHMRPIDIDGADATAFLQYMLANDVARLTASGKALYSCLLNEQGGVVDDLIVYSRCNGRYRLVVNAGTAEKDLMWLNAHCSSFAVTIQSRPDLAMIAVQGPEARAKTLPLLPAALRAAAETLAPFFSAELESEQWFIGRTGYTGEDGFELMMPAAQASDLWQALLAAGVKPCGLGARDTLRLEAGMNLYGHDMDDATGPLDAGLEWTVAWQPAEREFIGRAALTARRTDPARRELVGFILIGAGIMRDHQLVLRDGVVVGEITSGGFSPTLERSIALARIETGIDGNYTVDIRGKAVAARLVKPPFVRNGVSRIEL